MTPSITQVYSPGMTHVLVAFKPGEAPFIERCVSDEEAEAHAATLHAHGWAVEVRMHAEPVAA